MTDDLGKAMSRLEGYLAPYRAKGVPHRIGGQDVLGQTFDTHAPADPTWRCAIARGGPADIDAAAEAAQGAFADWARASGQARRAVLHRLADLIEARHDDIAVIEAWDTGLPLRFLAGTAKRGADNIRYFADKAPSARDGLSLPPERHMNITSRSPLGPVGIITPWNTPFLLATWKIAPALAAGCTLVHKPAELAPLSSRLWMELCAEAGLPDGVVNQVHGFGAEAGRALVEHPLIRAIGFVGEGRTGAAIMRQGAETLTRVHFELGGKNPIIVFDDADLDRAVDAIVLMIFALNGARCTSGSRLLVQRGVQAEVEARVAERAAAIRMGHPLDPATEVGPLINAAHYDKVTGYLDLARAEGAVVTGRGSWVDGGHFVAPTLVTGISPNSPVAREEIFGPVLCAMPFEDEAEALRLANDSAYGLTAYVWTRDGARGLRMAQGVEAGMVWVNSDNVRHLGAPFGGIKGSGIGRDGGDWSFEFYMEQKAMAFALDDHPMTRMGV